MVPTIDPQISALPLAVRVVAFSCIVYGLVFTVLSLMTNIARPTEPTLLYIARDFTMTCGFSKTLRLIDSRAGDGITLTLNRPISTSKQKPSNYRIHSTGSERPGHSTAGMPP